MPELKTNHRERDAAATDATRATARLPGLDIEIVHRRAVEGDAEQISVNLTAAPSLEAFGRALEAANPFGFWARVAQLAWQPWLGANWAMVGAMALPLRLALARPSGENASPHAPERGSVGGGALNPSPP